MVLSGTRDGLDGFVLIRATEACPSGSRPALVLAPARARALPGPCLVTTRPLRV